MSAVKKLLDTVEGAVDDAALGLLFSDSHLAGVKGMNVIVRNDIEIVKEGFVTSGAGCSSYFVQAAIKTITDIIPQINIKVI